MIPPEELRRSWKNGLLTTGYLLNLPWKVWPSSEKLRVTAQFQLADGRVFEADRDVTVRLTPLNQRPAVVPNTTPPDSRLPPTPLPKEGGPTLLPAPRLIDPAKPKTPPLADPLPGPALGAGREAPSPPSPPSAAEFLRPIPLEPDRLQ
jgi:hypothetical protein